MKNLEELYQYALTFHGLPYVWGGAGPKSYDCSGLAQVILAAGQADPPGDQTADALYRYYLKHGERVVPQLGALLFFGSRERVVHVAWSVDKYLMLHAGGGSSHVTSITIAKQQNAAVKVEPIGKRSDLVAAILPRYQFE